jgi:hypothetical protein
MVPGSIVLDLVLLLVLLRVLAFISTRDSTGAILSSPLKILAVLNIKRFLVLKNLEKEKDSTLQLSVGIRDLQG